MSIIKNAVLTGLAIVASAGVLYKHIPNDHAVAKTEHNISYIQLVSETDRMLHQIYTPSKLFSGGSHIFGLTTTQGYEATFDKNEPGIIHLRRYLMSSGPDCGDIDYVIDSKTGKILKRVSNEPVIVTKGSAICQPIADQTPNSEANRAEAKHGLAAIVTQPR